MIKIEKVTYSVWGNCLKLSNDESELYVTLDFGPRIIRFSIKGHENMFYENTDKSNHQYGKQFEVYGKNDGWYIYGGHRLWTSPEEMPRSYYPDNDKVDYDILTNDTVRFTPPQQKWNMLQLAIEVKMTNENKVYVKHFITNKSAWPVELAPWALTVLSQNGLEVISQPNKETGLLSNRTIAVWPYTKMNDERLYWGEKFITLKQNPSIDRALKIGINNEKGYAAFFNHGDLFIKRHTTVDGGNYPDGGVSFETYTNNDIIEMETLGQLKKLKPEETVTHEEIWQLIKDVKRPSDNEDDIEKTLEKYL